MYSQVLSQLFSRDWAYNIYNMELLSFKLVEPQFKKNKYAELLKVNSFIKMVLQLTNFKNIY